MNSILEHDDAIALMEQATLSPQQVADCQQHLQLPSAADLHASAASSASEHGADSGGDQLGVAA
jgi:hypothetical protein